uniref:Retrovirus-related Pol polyprotein from transposon TNT 1-94 n=1 Tax=Cajanus cajan TaxID=3821 RepID=A0A151R8U0_CAJCA|nr:Retrovirus-related Pol polyprotein from transposon TNT 1-94 [Cajanus cajan]
MITRSKSGIFKPRVLIPEIEPSTITLALQDSKWFNAMKEEYLALTRNQTWDLVPLPPHRKAIGSKWIFKLKYKPYGTISKHKARLVARGFSQQEGLDYTEMFSPVIKPVNIRIILSIALTKGWPIRQIDVNNAFLNGSLKEDIYIYIYIYMKQPGGFNIQHPTLVCRLKKAI